LSEVTGCQKTEVSDRTGSTAVLNKNKKNYWSEQSLTSLGMEDLIVKTALSGQISATHR